MKLQLKRWALWKLYYLMEYAKDWLVLRTMRLHRHLTGEGLPFQVRVNYDLPPDTVLVQDHTGKIQAVIKNIGSD
jgi:hypothetical protein